MVCVLQIPMFENCSCIANNLYDDMLSTGMASGYRNLLSNSTAARGLCEASCSFLPGFLAVVGIFIFLIFLIRVPFALVTIR